MSISIDHEYFEYLCFSSFYTSATRFLADPATLFPLLSLVKRIESIISLSVSPMIAQSMSGQWYLPKLSNRTIRFLGFSNSYFFSDLYLRFWASIYCFVFNCYFKFLENFPEWEVGSTLRRALTLESTSRVL